MFSMIFCFVNVCLELYEGVEEFGEILDGFKFWSIGLVFMLGWIVDIVIDLMYDNIWYVVVGLGGVWKIVNVGVIWFLIFDD